MTLQRLLANTEEWTSKPEAKYLNAHVFSSHGLGEIKIVHGKSYKDNEVVNRELKPPQLEDPPPNTYLSDTTHRNT